MIPTIYQQHILQEIPRLLSYLDRECFSPSYGCFDRFHWAWGAIDIANADLQKFTLPLAYVYQCNSPDNPYYQQPSLLSWIEAAIQFCCAEQSRQGGFNQWLPNDNSIVSACFVMHDLILVAELLVSQLTQETIKQLEKAALRAANLLIRFEERHGFNSNHHLANATALLDIHQWLPHASQTARCHTRALDIIRQVLKHQAPSGAFYEYAGADLGYHTLGLAFLAACYVRHPADFILKSLRAAVQFSARFINPVSGNGGGYGTRGTHLLYPLGFEIAARHGIHPELPEQIAAIIADNLTVTPHNTDLTNLIPLLSDYTRVCLLPAITITHREASPAPSDFFCEATTLFAYPRGTCLLHGRLNGGMLMIHSLQQQKILLSSTGYTVECGKVKGFSGIFNGTWTREGNRLSFKTRFQKTNRIRLTPFQLIALRSYFFWLGNIMFFNLLVKKIMAWLLIFKQTYLNLTLDRQLLIQPTHVQITDRVTNHTRRTFTLRHCEQGYIHFMGSARYFDASHLRLANPPSIRERKNQSAERTTQLHDVWTLYPEDC